MQITLTWQGVITAASVLGALLAIVAFFAKIVRWVDKQSQQDEEIRKLKAHHEDDIKCLKEEQTLLVYGILACLKGLKEQGCNGPVTEAINKYEKYLNQKAHQ